MNISEVVEKVQENSGAGLSEIGHGTFRHTYRLESAEFDEYQGEVIKVSRSSAGSKANKHEFQTWMAVSGTACERFFSPVRDHSKDFECLIMDYVEPIHATVNDVETLTNELYLTFDEVFEVDEIPLEDQNRLDIRAENIGSHPKKGCVLVDYPWGGDIEWTM